MSKVEVSNDELRTVRDAMRELNRMVDLLESGGSEKFVLTKHGQMRAVVVSVDYFSQLRPPSVQAADALPELPQGIVAGESCALEAWPGSSSAAGQATA